MIIRYRRFRTTEITHKPKHRKLVDRFAQFPLPTQLALIICGFCLLVLVGINQAAAEAITGFILAINAIIHNDKGKPTQGEE